MYAGKKDETGAGAAEVNENGVLAGAVTAGAENIDAGSAVVALVVLNMLEALVAGTSKVVSERLLSPAGAVVGNTLVVVDCSGTAAGNNGACNCCGVFFKKSKTPPEPCVAGRAAASVLAAQEKVGMVGLGCSGAGVV